MFDYPAYIQSIATDITKKSILASICRPSPLNEKVNRSQIPQFANLDSLVYPTNEWKSKVISRTFTSIKKNGAKITIVNTLSSNSSPTGLEFLLITETTTKLVRLTLFDVSTIQNNFIRTDGKIEYRINRDDAVFVGEYGENEIAEFYEENAAKVAVSSLERDRVWARDQETARINQYNL